MKIKFIGKDHNQYYLLKLGPMEDPNPSEREFIGGDIIIAQVIPTEGKNNCSDLYFEDDTFALEVPNNFFEIL